MKLFEKKSELPKRHAALLLEDDPLYQRLDPRPLRVALAQVKEAKAAGSEDVAALAKWKADLEEWEKIADPRNDDHVRQRLLLKDRINLMPRFIAEAGEKLDVLIDELVKEATSFENAFRRVNDEEANAKADEIERLLKPFCIDYHTPPVTGSKRVNQARALAFQCGAFGFFGAPLARELHGLGFRSNYIQPDKPEAVDAFDNQAQSRAEELLASFDAWRARGGRVIPGTLPDCLPPQS